MLKYLFLSGQNAYHSAYHSVQNAYHSKNAYHSGQNVYHSVHLKKSFIQNLPLWDNAKVFVLIGP